MPICGGFAPLLYLTLSLCTSDREKEEEEEKALEPPEAQNPKPRGMQKSRSHTGLERQKTITEESNCLALRLHHHLCLLQLPPPPNRSQK
jgi:hypothetical protein